MKPCLWSEIVWRLFTDELTPAELASGEDHLRLCQDCRDQLNALTSTKPTAAVAFHCQGLSSSLAAGTAAAPLGFELLGVLGVGQTATVYQAWQLRLKRVVALKMFFGGWPTAEETRRRFQTEIEASASLNHPGVVQVFEVGTHQERPFLVLEYCAGGNLADRLRDGARPPREAAALIETLARILQEVHAAQLIHRDLKPANVLFDGSGRAKITDFGVVKRLNIDEVSTSTGNILGTPPYLAPEQIDGSAPVGPPCDVYALGTILYECLVGRPPFRAAAVVNLLDDVLHREPLPPRLVDQRLPRDLETICLKCLDKEPARRYHMAIELAEDLRRFLNGQPVKARRIGLAGRAWRWSSRNRLTAALVVSLFLTLGVGSIVCGWLWHQTMQNGRVAEENFQRTRRLLPDLVAAGNGPWHQVSERRHARRTALERANGLYSEFCADRPDDYQLRGERAEVLSALTEIALAEERYESARDTAQEALGLLATLPQDMRAEPHWRQMHADTLLKLVDAWRNLRQIDKMIGGYHEALEIYRQLADDRPENAEYLVAACEARLRLFVEPFHYLGQTDQQQPLLEDNRRRLTTYLRHGDSATVRLALVNTLHSLGNCYDRRGNNAAALECWREGYKWGAGLEVALPHEATAWSTPTMCARRLPSNEPGFLPPGQAILRLERAVQLVEASLVFDPDNIAAAMSLMNVTRNLADCYTHAGRPMDALRAQRRAFEIKPARPTFALALELERLEGLASLGWQEFRVGEKEMALGHARDTADGFEKFCADHAAEPVLLLDAVLFTSHVAPQLRHVGAHDQSRRVADQGLRVAQEIERQHPDAIHLRALSEAWNQRAKCLVHDDPDRVEEALAESVAVARRLVALDSENRFILDDKLCRLARHLGDVGRLREAVACLRECEGLWPGEANGLRGVASYYRKLAEQVSDGKNEHSPAQWDERNAYLAEAARLEKVADALQP